METGGGSTTYRQEQASASKDTRRCNQRQVASAGRNKREEEQASASKDMRRCNQKQVASAGGNKRERDRRNRSKRQQARISADAIRDR